MQTVMIIAAIYFVIFEFWGAFNAKLACQFRKDKRREIPDDSIENRLLLQWRVSMLFYTIWSFAGLFYRDWRTAGIAVISVSLARAFLPNSVGVQVIDSLVCIAAISFGLYRVEW